jgi:hypothetical protein
VSERVRERETPTLPPAAADLPEAGSITQTVEPLLFDKLHDLWLDLLPQLPTDQREKQSETETSQSHTQSDQEPVRQSHRHSERWVAST